MEQESTPASAEVRKPGLLSRTSQRFGQWLGNTRELAQKARDAPYQSMFVSMVFIVLGWIGQDGYVWAKSQIIDEDTAIDRIATQQKEEFEALRASLDGLRGDIQGAGLGEAKDAVRALERLSHANLDKLRLAQQENEKLRLALSGAGKITGGYDALLSEQESMQLDPGTVLGVNNITDSGVWVTLSTPDSAGQSRSQFVRPGGSLPFVRRSGDKCVVSVLSLRDGVDAASFAVSCETGRSA